MLDDCD